MLLPSLLTGPLLSQACAASQSAEPVTTLYVSDALASGVAAGAGALAVVTLNRLVSGHFGYRTVGVAPNPKGTIPWEELVIDECGGRLRPTGRVVHDRQRRPAKNAANPANNYSPVPDYSLLFKTSGRLALLAQTVGVVCSHMFFEGASSLCLDVGLIGVAGFVPTFVTEKARQRKGR